MEIWHHLPDKKLKSLKLKCVVNAPDTIQIEPIRFDVMEEIPFGGQRMDICKSTHSHTQSLTHTEPLLPFPLQIKTAAQYLRID